MTRGSDVFWRWLPAVRSTERGRVLFFMSVAALVTAGQTLGLASLQSMGELAQGGSAAFYDQTA